jgi:hypothetical protein
MTYGRVFVNMAKIMLARRVKPFIMKKDVLYKMGLDNKLRRCLLTTQVQKAMKELHEGTIGSLCN